jgi:hypothetical protein
MRRWTWLIVLLLISPHFLVGCDSRGTEPEKVDRGMFDKRKMPPRPVKK